MKMFYEKDADVDLIKNKKIAIFGYLPAFRPVSRCLDMDGRCDHHCVGPLCDAPRTDSPGFG